MGEPTPREVADPRLPRVRISTPGDADEQLRRVCRHERVALRGEEREDATVPSRRDERSGAPEAPDFRWYGPF